MVGASVVFTDVIGAASLTFRYASVGDRSTTVIENGQNIRIGFPDTRGTFALRTIQTAVPQGTTAIVQRNADNNALGLTIDWMRVSN